LSGDNKHLWFGNETTCRQATCSAVDLRRKFRNDVSKFQATFTTVNDVLLGLAYLVRAYFGKNEQSDRTNLNGDVPLDVADLSWALLP
jgi:NRPS condensation-like uncharacterized protein